MRFKKRAYEILEVAAPGDLPSRLFDIFILSLIFLNVVAAIAETVQSVYSRCPGLFGWFEFASVVIFSIEYALRIWSCTVSPIYTGSVRGRLRFALTPLALVDLFAVLPAYLPFLGTKLLFIRAVRLTRFFRVAKLARYSMALRTFGRVLSAKREELAMALFFLSLGLLFSSVFMYFAEHPTNANDFPSIPAAMWWAIATLTTVGYGDVVPKTSLGKVVGSLVAIIGVAVFTLPTAILASGFFEEV